MKRKILRKYKIKDRGVKPGLFYVLALSKRPSILLEVGFLSHQKERQKIIVPVMGMVVKNLTAADKKKFKTKSGVKITGVPERYRGYGLSGKVIIMVDDKDITNITDANTAFGAISKYGKTVITMLNEDGERERLIFQ